MVLGPASVSPFLTRKALISRLFASGAVRANRAGTLVRRKPGLRQVINKEPLGNERNDLVPQGQGGRIACFLSSQVGKRRHRDTHRLAVGPGTWRARWWRLTRWPCDFGQVTSALWASVSCLYSGD